MTLLEPPLIVLVLLEARRSWKTAIPLKVPDVGAVMLLLAWAFEENVPIVAFDAVLVFVNTIVHPLQLKVPLRSTPPPFT